MGAFPYPKFLAIQCSLNLWHLWFQHASGQANPDAPDRIVSTCVNAHESVSPWFLPFLGGKSMVNPQCLRPQPLLRITFKLQQDTLHCEGTEGLARSSHEFPEPSEPTRDGLDRQQ